MMMRYFPCCLSCLMMGRATPYSPNEEACIHKVGRWLVVLWISVSIFSISFSCPSANFRNFPPFGNVADNRAIRVRINSISLRVVLYIKFIVPIV